MPLLTQNNTLKKNFRQERFLPLGVRFHLKIGQTASGDSHAATGNETASGRDRRRQRSDLGADPVPLLRPSEPFRNTNR